MRISLIGKKVGMSQIKYQGRTVAVTLLQILDHDVLRIKTHDKDGYDAIVLSAGDIKKEKNVSKPVLTQYKKAGITPRCNIFEVRLKTEKPIKSVEKKDQNILSGLLDRFVDVSGTTIGKGFAGVMKRHLFAGLEASHGVSISHRSHGSTGQRQDPGRVFPGKKMAGHMGDVRCTIQNLKIVNVDEDIGLIAVLGAIPGAKNSYVKINDSVKMGRQDSFTQINNINLVF